MPRPDTWQFNEWLAKDKKGPNKLEQTQDQQRIIDAIRELQHICHMSSYHAGWWKKDQGLIMSAPPELKDYAQAVVVLAKLDLQHSELSEATEGFRKDLQDDHLPERKMVEVELADGIIRILDLAGWLKLDVAEAIIEKLAYNRQRADHKMENRDKPGGKKI